MAPRADRARAPKPCPDSAESPRDPRLRHGNRPERDRHQDLPRTVTNPTPRQSQKVIGFADRRAARSAPPDRIRMAEDCSGWRGANAQIIHSVRPPQTRPPSGCPDHIGGYRAPSLSAIVSSAAQSRAVCMRWLAECALAHVAERWLSRRSRRRGRYASAAVLHCSTTSAGTRPRERVRDGGELGLEASVVGAWPAPVIRLQMVFRRRAHAFWTSGWVAAWNVAPGVPPMPVSPAAGSSPATQAGARTAGHGG